MKSLLALNLLVVLGLLIAFANLALSTATTATSASPPVPPSPAPGRSRLPSRRFASLAEATTTTPAPSPARTQSSRSSRRRPAGSSSAATTTTTTELTPGDISSTGHRRRRVFQRPVASATTMASPTLRGGGLSELSSTALVRQANLQSANGEGKPRRTLQQHTLRTTTTTTTTSSSSTSTTTEGNTTTTTTTAAPLIHTSGAEVTEVTDILPEEVTENTSIVSGSASGLEDVAFGGHQTMLPVAEMKVEKAFADATTTLLPELPSSVYHLSSPVSMSTSTEEPTSTTVGTTLGAFRSRHQRQPSPRSRRAEQVGEVIAAEASEPRFAISKERFQMPGQKAPRMIQRMVAGHIQNARGRSTYQISSASGALSSGGERIQYLQPSGKRVNALAASRSVEKPMAALGGHPYQKRDMEDMIEPMAATKLQITANIIDHTNYKQRPNNANKNTSNSNSLLDEREQVVEEDDEEAEAEDHDDEALLEDVGDFDNWDNGILRLSAGSGKETSGGGKAKKSKKDEAKKTLADQVRDGKYGLIEKELFRKTPKRPGVLSYLPNKEVPHDNEHNFGGLNEDDIWLAEDHLLVIKGGGLNEDRPDEPWPPIDDYKAPERQIKIPANPKVPPPFPVQLEENGPVQLIGNNKLTVVYPVSNESVSVYTVGAKANHPSSSGDGGHEKNSLARPGTLADLKEKQPFYQYNYNYPSPPPPWRYHNQTFVNPALKNARPLKFPFLGPFPFGRNNSVWENISSTDDFDEDDPAYYYPPAYSFVYKSNYTSPVAPGPLVPGIVVPPPPEQFGRLEGSVKNRSGGQKHTTTTTTSTTTMLSPISGRQPVAIGGRLTPLAGNGGVGGGGGGTRTTEVLPFGNVITKVSEYVPKTINIVTPAPPSVQTPTPASPANNLNNLIEPVPVPVAVPIPIYPVNYESTAQPVVSFVPTTTAANDDTFSKSNPIYYEYFEAKRQPSPPSSPVSNVIDEFLATTNKPPAANLALSRKPVKLYATNQKRPYKTRTYLQSLPANNRPFMEDVVVITPKPEIRHKAPASTRPDSVYKTRPLSNFEREVDQLHETLRLYHNQELPDNNIPRAPKAKPVFDYNFDGTKSNSFQPPAEFDEEPFKPMVTYSPPANDENSFQAVNVNDKAKLKKNEAGRDAADDLQGNAKYVTTTTTLLPVLTGQGRAKKLRLRSKYLPQAAGAGGLQYEVPGRVPHQGNWVAIQKHQEMGGFAEAEFPSSHNRENGGSASPDSLQVAVPILKFKHRIFPSYYYGTHAQPPPLQPMRQNNRFYEEPFLSTPNRKVNQYRTPQTMLRQPQQQQAPLWSLENDTYVNYAPNRPPLNPDAEFINPYQLIPLQSYPAARPLPALSHQSQYFAPPHFRSALTRPHYQAVQQAPPPTHIPLHRDILVNYRQPLPPVNPDSEFVSHPQVVRASPAGNGASLYRPTGYRLSAAHLPPLAEAAAPLDNDLFYLTSKFRRANANGDTGDKAPGGTNLDSGASSSTNNNNNNNNNHNGNIAATKSSAAMRHANGGNSKDSYGK